MIPCCATAYSISTHGRPHSGIIEIPPTLEQIEAEQIEAEQKYQAKRAKDRERLRRWRERQKAKPITTVT